MENKELTVGSTMYGTKVVIDNLSGLMTKVTKESCTPETVNAACNCANEITKILRLHLDAAKLKIKGV